MCAYERHDRGLASGAVYVDTDDAARKCQKFVLVMLNFYPTQAFLRVVILGAIITVLLCYSAAATITVLLQCCCHGCSAAGTITVLLARLQCCWHDYSAAAVLLPQCCI